MNPFAVFLFITGLTLSGIISSEAFIAKRTSQCGGADYLTQNNGEISSHSGLDAGHNYGKNMNCIWKIEAPANLFVELIATKFDVEDDPTCSFDWIELFDGEGTHASSLGKFCGRRFNPISSSQRFLTLQFMTDGDTQLSGFKMFYNFTETRIISCASDQFMCDNGKCIDQSLQCDGDDDCGDDSDEVGSCGAGGGGAACKNGEFQCHDRTCISLDWLCDGDDDCTDKSDELPQNCHAHQAHAAACGPANRTGTHGTITSPNYPSAYTSDLHCSYYIKAPEGTTSLSFNFDTNFHLEPDEQCTFDFVRVSGEMTSSTHGPYCGPSAPGPFSIHGDHAFVFFTTDSSDEFTGFSLSWNAQS